MSTKRERIAELAKIHPDLAFTSLNQYLDYEWLLYAYQLTRKDGAVGIDGQTAADYVVNLDGNLNDLLERLKSGRYQAPAVRRHYIPKGDGGRRPLGIPTFEDKVAQRAVVLLLEPIYEQDFHDCSYGFRPQRNAHQALRSLRNHIMDDSGTWILDVDLRKYFDSIEYAKLRAVLDKRVVDGVIRKLIDKWLKAGVMEQGRLHYVASGTPQGGVISPLLANVFLHYALDEWFVKVVQPRLAGPASLTRYADDFVMVFKSISDVSRVWKALEGRMRCFGLQLHPEKTRLVDFRFRRPQQQGRHSAMATTFNFLGFTHVWSKSRRGKWIVLQKTAKDRVARTLKAINERCRLMRHDPIREQQRRLSAMLKGHYSYFGITGNDRALRVVHHQVERFWHKWLCRRSRKSHIPWRNFRSLLNLLPLPRPQIVHRYTAAC
ncbi:group II intron reverse transcriptase/maturase [Methylomonas sp. YC3]